MFASVLLIGCGGGRSDAAGPPGSSGSAGTAGSGGRTEKQMIHPAFTITRSDLETALSSLPGATTALILDRPAAFLDLMKEIVKENPWLTVLVDKTHPLPDTYIPEDLVPLSSYPLTCSRTDLEVRELLVTDLLAMDEAARNAGLTLVMSSAFRTWQYQAALYERNVRELGQEQADRESARPGTSQHQLGLTIDFGSVTDEFADTPEGKWLAEHAWEYGFSLSYPAGLEELTGYRYESWHYRYIGRPAAMMEREYFNGVQQNLLLFLNEHLPFFAERFTDAGR